MPPTPVEFLPLRHTQFHILLPLTKGTDHGYGILKEIETEMKRGFRVSPATLYRSTKRMLETKLNEKTGEQPDPQIDDERRRYYKLSSLGRRVVSAEAQRLTDLVKNADESYPLEKRASIDTWGKNA